MMNYDKAYDLVKNNHFCDLKLTIDDGTNKFVINVHKIILYSSCIYFEKLLMFGENQLNDILMMVPNAYVTRDIIMNFYGQKINSGSYPEWKIYLESYRCYDFLGLEFDISDIRHLIVPEEGFELLLDVIELIGYNDETIKLLITNLPENYDLKKLPKELLTEMIELSRNHYYIAEKYDELYVCNLITHDIIKKIPICDFSEETKHEYGDIILSPDNSQIAYVSEENNIVIWSIDTAQILHTIKINYYATKLSYSPDSKNLAFNKSNEIFIIDTEYGSIINTFKTYQKISQIRYLNNDKILIVHEFSKNLRVKVSRIKIYDIKTGNFVKNLIDCRYKINKLLCTEKYLVIIGCDYKIRLYNIETNNLNILKGHTKFIADICFNQNATKLASSSYDGIIIIWDIETGEKINTIQNIINNNNNNNNDDGNNNDDNDNDDNDDNGNDNDDNDDNNNYDDNDDDDNDDDDDDNDDNGNDDNDNDDNDDDDDDNDDDDNDDNNNDNNDNDDNDNDDNDNDDDDNNDDDNDNDDNNNDSDDKLFCIFRKNMNIIDNIYYDNDTNSYDNGYYYYVMNSFYRYTKYPKSICWTDYKDQLMVKYDNYDIVLMEYNTGIITQNIKHFDSLMHYFYRDNEKLVDKIKIII
ncbi:putative BTB/POZ domain-containing protein [Megavirus lba]|uniref:Putative BTB/POZ domain-containing protein n=1 Tax=Megavirus lba TaxID=1235314 RepID=L7XZI7_9VIRU|nr:putative BTB/POZ domain-containing protein [Megavirus lba]